MSFSSTVKEEIIEGINNRDKSKACLYGMFVSCKEFSENEITLLTANESVAVFFKNSINRLLKEEIVFIERTAKNTRINKFIVTLKEKDYIKRILDLYKINNTQEIDYSVIGKKKFYSFFIAGCFLVCGSVNDPLKEYHFEFVCQHNDNLNKISEILLQIGIEMKTTIRKNCNVLYIKESENIEDILTYMGASKSSLEIMNVKILKDVRNKINRAVNCDNANIEKTLKAAEKQIEDIEFIQNKIGLDNISKELRDIAVLRLENPDWNLKELAAGLIPSISRSGANHRLNRIKKIAEELKSKV